MPVDWQPLGLNPPIVCDMPTAPGTKHEAPSLLLLLASLSLQLSLFASCVGESNSQVLSKLPDDADECNERTADTTEWSKISFCVAPKSHLEGGTQSER